MTKTRQRNHRTYKALSFVSGTVTLAILAASLAFAFGGFPGDPAHERVLGGVLMMGLITGFIVIAGLVASTSDNAPGKQRKPHMTKGTSTSGDSTAAIVTTSTTSTSSTSSSCGGDGGGAC